MRLGNVLLSLAITLLMANSLVAAVSAKTNLANQANKAGDKPADPDGVSGTYAGVAKSQALGDIAVSFEIKVEHGRLTATIDTPQGKVTSTSGSYARGKIMARFEFAGNQGTVTAEHKNGVITGAWQLAGQTGTVEMKKVGAGGTENKRTDTTVRNGAGSADPISGEWDASAEIQGSAVPFTIKLKLEGSRVTGESNSTQGTMPVEEGSWIDGKLSLTFSAPSGPIVLTGVLKDGKLVGEYELAGQMKGKWEAKKN
jgi:hypothetical protein